MWKFAPAIAGIWILVSLLVILAALRVGAAQFMAALKRSFSQMWGALLVAPIVFGLAQVFNYSGMAGTPTYGFSLGKPVAPQTTSVGVSTSSHVRPPVATSAGKAR